MTINHFEDLDAWKCARSLTNMVYSLCRDTDLAADRSLCDQFRRAAVSVMNNIAEGFERGSNKDFARFVYISRGSVGEVRSMLYVALDQHFITKEQFETTQELSTKCSQLCWGLIRHLQKNSNWKAGDHGS